MVKENKIVIDWVEIPAGDFIYGEGNRAEIRTTSSVYLISKSPITYAQYKQYIDANSESPVPKDWERESRTHKQKFGNHPVVHISYKMAEAFCEWAGCRLPTEEEWEKAARGENGNKYPWGNNLKGWPKNLANFNHREIIKFGTSPVNDHPDGASPYGVLDMAGNVYEWTSGWFDRQQLHRVGRGGYWGNNKYHITTTYRKNLHPEFESPAVGFRPVKSG